MAKTRVDIRGNTGNQLLGLMKTRSCNNKKKGEREKKMMGNIRALVTDCIFHNSKEDCTVQEAAARVPSLTHPTLVRKYISSGLLSSVNQWCSAPSGGWIQDGAKEQFDSKLKTLKTFEQFNISSVGRLCTGRYRRDTGPTEESAKIWHL